MTQSLIDHTDILVEKFGISPDVVDDALETRRQRGGALDTAFLEAGIRAETLLAWMSEVFQAPTADYADIRETAQTLTQHFPRHLAETFRVFPLELTDNQATLVCYQPLVERLMTQLEQRLQRSLTFRVTTETNFHAGLQHLYGKSPRPRWATLIEVLQSELEESRQTEDDLEEMGLNDLEPRTELNDTPATTTVSVHHWLLLEKRGQELILAASSSQELEPGLVIPSAALSWLPPEGNTVDLQVPMLNQSPLGETISFRGEGWTCKATTNAELELFVFTSDLALPEVEKLALDVALGRYRRDIHEAETQEEEPPREEPQEAQSASQGATLISQLVVPPATDQIKTGPNLGQALGLLTSNNSELWKEAVESLRDLDETKLHGFLAEHFPGNILVDPLSDPEHSKPLAAYSGFVFLAIEFPFRSAAILGDLLESNDPTTRYFALRFFTETSTEVPIDLQRIARRLFDSKKTIRTEAIRCLQTRREDPSYQEVLEVFENRLLKPAPSTQVATIHLLGQLRELRGVNQIVNLCAAEHPILAKAAQSFMALMTGHHFGADIDAWKTWWLNHGHSARSVWLVRALRSRDTRLRQVAIEELKRLHQGEDFGFDPGARSPRREKSVRQWEQLLDDEGLNA